jgi:hypothetical protein
MSHDLTRYVLRLCGKNESEERVGRTSRSSGIVLESILEADVCAKGLTIEIEGLFAKWLRRRSQRSSNFLSVPTTR